MAKVRAISSQQNRNFLHLIQFIISIVLTPCSALSTLFLANAFIIFLLYRPAAFTLKSWSQKAFKEVYLHSSDILEDRNRYVVLHDKVCHLLSLKSFDWILLSFHVCSDVGEGTCFQKVFQVISSSQGKHLEIAVTDDTLHSILSRLNTSEDNVGVTFVRKMANYSPGIAKTATVQLLEQFHLPNVKVIDDIFYSYFSHPRFLRKNDIFTVDVLQYYPEKFYSMKHFTPGDLQCKIVNVQGEKETEIEGFLVTNNETSLSQLHNYQGFVPVKKCHENSSDQDLKVTLTPLLPEGFHEYFSQILSWCNLFIKNNQNDLHLLPFFLVSGAEGSGKSMLLESAAMFLGLQYFKTDCTFLQTPTPGYADAQLKNLFIKFKKCAPCLIHFTNFEAVCINSNGTKDDRLVSSFINHFYDLKSEWPVVIFATAQNSSEISATIARLFLESLEVLALDEEKRKSVVSWVAEQRCISIEPSCLDSLAKQTTGFLFADLVNLFDQTILNLYRISSPTNVSNRSLEWEDFKEAFKKIQARHASSIGAPQIPAVSWDDVGGLGPLKQEILKSLSTLPISNNLRRSGLLLHGPPGTGKTLIAKAIATECNFNFLSVKGPELLNMYVGQSEQNVREVFSRARSASPCVVFFDELDSLAPNRGKNGDSGGVMDRVVSQLLAEMDDVQKSEGIFVLGATNRPDLIDPALLRPGRLDKLLYVGPCEDDESKLHVLKAVTRKFNLSQNVELEVIANELSRKVTGADISAVCSAAWLNAARRLISEHETQGVSGTPLVKTVVVSKEDFQVAIEAVR